MHVSLVMWIPLPEWTSRCCSVPYSLGGAQEGGIMFCFGKSAGVSIAPLQDPTAVKFGREADLKKEDAPAKEDAQKMDAPHKTHKGTGGSQAHSFVRHLIHNAAARCETILTGGCAPAAS